MGKTHLSGLNLRLSAISEGVAGTHTCTGITVDDTLLSVQGVHIDMGAGTPNTITMTAVNLTSEFTISSADEIDNTGGTDLTDTIVFAIWIDVDQS